jgi:Tol biopolymer transport system component
MAVALGTPIAVGGAKVSTKPVRPATSASPPRPTGNLPSHIPPTPDDVLSIKRHPIKRAALVYFENTESPRLVALSAKNGEPRRLPLGAMPVGNEQPPFALSPDGSTVAIIDRHPAGEIDGVRNQGWFDQLRFVELKSGRVKTIALPGAALLSEQFITGGLSWSPNGTSLAFGLAERASRSDALTTAVAVFDTASRHLDRIASIDLGASTPVWGGGGILAVGGVGEGGAGVTFLDVDSGTVIEQSYEETNPVLSGSEWGPENSTLAVLESASPGGGEKTVLRFRDAISYSLNSEVRLDPGLGIRQVLGWCGGVPILLGDQGILKVAADGTRTPLISVDASLKKLQISVASFILERRASVWHESYWPPSSDYGELPDRIPPTPADLLPIEDNPIERAALVYFENKVSPTLVALSAYGGERRRLPLADMPLPDGAVEQPRFALSPDGSTVAIIDREGPFDQLRFVELNSGREKAMTLPGTLGLSERYITGGLSWSPDGTLLAFGLMERMSRSDALTGTVAVFDPATQKLERIAVSDLDVQATPVWTPDGSSFLVTIYRYGWADLRFIDRSGNVLAQWLGYGSPNLSGAEWSPDGVTLAIRDGAKMQFVDVWTGSKYQALLPPTDDPVMMRQLLGWGPSRPYVYGDNGITEYGDRSPFIPVLLDPETTQISAARFLLLGDQARYAGERWTEWPSWPEASATPHVRSQALLVAFGIGFIVVLFALGVREERRRTLQQSHEAEGEHPRA